MKMLYGAIAAGRPGGVDGCSTVEARAVDGSRWVLLAAVAGDLATPALEGVKAAFAKLAAADADAAASLLSAAPPPPYAAGVAVVLLAGGRAFVAASGTARCYRERGTLEALSAGAHDLAPGDAVVAAGDAGLAVGRPFLGANLPSAGGDAFERGGLDGALEAALSRNGGRFVALAAAHAGAG